MSVNNFVIMSVNCEDLIIQPLQGNLHNNRIFKETRWLTHVADNCSGGYCRDLWHLAARQKKRSEQL